MNILYLCDEYPPGRHGGIGTAVQLLAREMVQKGHNVVVAGFYDWGYGEADTFIDEGVKVYRFRRILYSSFFSRKNSLIVRIAYRLFMILGIFQWDITHSLKRYRLFLENIIERYNIDIIEAPDFNDYVQFCIKFTPFPVLSKPTIVKLHSFITNIERERGRDVRPLIYKMENSVLHNATYVTSVSKHIAEKTSLYFNYKKDIVVLYNGIDINIGIDHVKKDTKTVIFSGSLTENKGIYQLMKAWNIVNKQLPQSRLYIYGKGQVKHVQAYLTKDIINTVTFWGHVPRQQLFIALARAQVAVFPSYSESFGLAVVEAMNCGTAVIYTANPPGPEIIENGIDGLLIDPSNTVDIASQILFLLENGYICAEIAKRGKEKVKKQFDISIIADKNIEFYNHIINNGKH